MTKTYQGEGIGFDYPHDWEISEDHDDSLVCITVSDGGTAFWTITLLFDRPQPKLSLQETIASFEDYDDVETEHLEAEIAGQTALACDVRFACYDLLNSAFIRAFRTGRFTAVVLFQATDDELSIQEPLFAAICQSLDCHRDGAIQIG